MSAVNPRRFIIALAFLCGLAVLPLYAWKVHLKTDYTDFDVYYRAAARVRAGEWDRVYTFRDGASPFRYAPLTLPFWRPFAELSPEAAKLAWYGLQYLWFLAGFLLIHRTLRRMQLRDTGVTAAFSALFVLRLCLDCFTIGQVSSLLFLGYCASFYFWSVRRSGAASACLLLPAAFKIGPGFLFPLFLKGRGRERLAAVAAPLLALGAVGAGATIWIGPWARGRMLWRGWIRMVAGDSSYYDASHYGSQSIKSALLRLANRGWLSQAGAIHLWAALGALICGTVLLFWLLRRPRGLFGRSLFFALGIFPYLWVMPETFKYSLTVLAIPVALIFQALQEQPSADPTAPGAPALGPAERRLHVFSLAFGALVISLAGLDVVGAPLFFGLQKASLPLVATFFLGASIARLALRFSEPSSLAGQLSIALWHPAMGPLEREAPPASLDATLIAPLPMEADFRVNLELVERILLDTDRTLEARDGRSHELLIAPYGDRVSRSHPAWRRIEGLAEGHPRIRLEPGATGLARSHALRRAFLLSRGKTILFLHLEQPCDAAFFERALAEIDAGAGLVRGNRRLRSSRFRIPVRLLRLVHGRHRLGLLFNRVVRAALPIKVTDTHSGNLAIRRELARAAFELQSASDFLFDLELSLVARSHGFSERDLPLTLHLAEEKSVRRMFRETASILVGLPRLARRYRRGLYDPPRVRELEITADDWGISPGVNQAILELARLGVVRRVSILARSRFLRDGLEELKGIPGVGLGLHFDLTFDRKPPVSAGALLARWLNPLRERERLRRELRGELDAQLALLAEQGVRPLHLDGHQHVHLIPGVIDALAEPLARAGIRKVRLPYDPGLWLTPKAPINILSLAARRRLRARGFVSLRCFYPRPSHFRDPGLLRARLARQGESEVIVHPSVTDDFGPLRIPDPYSAGRVTEYRALRMLARRPDATPTPTPTPAPAPRAQHRERGARWPACLRYLIPASLLAGAILRLIYTSDMEWKEDEYYNYVQSQAIGGGHPWPWVGMPSGVYLANPGMSIWVFVWMARIVALGARFLGLDASGGSGMPVGPLQLARGVSAFAWLGIALLIPLSAQGGPIARPAEREPWLWAVALAMVNPFEVFYQRKLWPEPFLPLFCVLLLMGWWRRDGFRGALLWGFVGALLGQIHMSGFFLAFGLFSWTALTSFFGGDPRKPRWSGWLLGSCLGTLPLLPWLAYLLSHPTGEPMTTGLSEILQFKFWVFWVTDPLGLVLTNPLGLHRGNSILSQLSDFIRYPLIAGRATYLCAAAHLAALLAAVLILGGAAWRMSRRLARRMARREPGTPRRRSAETALAVSAALWGFGIALTLTGVNIRRYYMMVAFPLPFVWLAGLALSGPSRPRARRLLAVLWGAELLISTLFVHYIHVNQGSRQGDYGDAYHLQQERQLRRSGDRWPDLRLFHSNPD